MIEIDIESLQVAGKGWTGTVTCSMAPAQIEGNADGVFFYFRNRHGAVWFGLGDSPDTAVDAAMEQEGVLRDGAEWFFDLDDYQLRIEAIELIDRLLAGAV